MTTNRKLGTSAAAVLLLAALCTAHAATASAQPNARPYGDARTLAGVPAPGFPEGIAVKGNRVYVSGPATFGTAGQGPSAVFAFDIKTGALLDSYFAQGENLAQEHANSCVALDGDGRLYVNNTQLGVYRLDFESGQQESYSAPFPDIPMCAAAAPGQPCSPTPFDAPALPNDLAFDDAGNLYVTDSLQATIWRIAPGGGQPQVWFQDARFASGSIGTNGLRLDPKRENFYVAVTADLAGQGYVYRLPLKETPTAADLSVFHHYAAGESPDGIAFGKSGKLYVALAAPFQSGISILNPDGTEGARLTNPAGSPIAPYDSPANIAFNHTGSLLTTNHAFVTMVNFSVLDVYVNDKAAPMAKPSLP